MNNFYQGTRSPALQGWSRVPRSTGRSALGCLSVGSKKCLRIYVRFVFQKFQTFCRDLETKTFSRSALAERQTDGSGEADSSAELPGVTLNEPDRLG